MCHTHTPAGWSASLQTKRTHAHFPRGTASETENAANPGWPIHDIPGHLAYGKLQDRLLPKLGTTLIFTLFGPFFAISIRAFFLDGNGGDRVFRDNFKLQLMRD